MSAELTPDQRWELGMAHDPRSEEIVHGLQRVDLELDGLYFDWKTGGDGDIGEALAYQLDCYFHRKDKGEK